MAKVNPALLAFNRGEVGKAALARVDLAKLQLAAECQLNWMPSVVGEMMLRPGLGHIGETYSDRAAQLIDFVYSKDDSALLELTDSFMRVWINDGLLTRPSVSTTVSDPNFAGGGTWSTSGTTAGCTTAVSAGTGKLTATARGGLARLSQTLTIAGGDQNKEHGLRIAVGNGPITFRAGSGAGFSDLIAQTVLDNGTHSLSFTPTTGTVVLQFESTDPWLKWLTNVSIEAAGVVTLPTPWLGGVLSSLRWAQSKDVLYVGQYGGRQYQIERRGTRPNARGWSVVRYRPDNGPFLDAPTAALTLTPNVMEGNGTLSASAPFFSPNHAGALFRLFTPGQTNDATLGAANAFTEPVRITGVNTDRVFHWQVAGTFSGTLSLQRSLVGPDEGFTDVTTQTAPGTYVQDDTNSSSTPGLASLNNVIAWYRVGFPPGQYTSGSALVSFTPASGAQPAIGGGRYGICRVIGYTDPQTVGIEVLDPFSAAVPTTSWQESAWSPVQGWPSAVTLQEGRLWWFGATRFPVVGSQSDEYSLFATADRYGASLGDEGAILEDFGEGPADRVNWGLGLSRLLAGREGSVASIRSSSFDSPLTPTDIAVKDCSQQGTSRLPAIKVGKRGIFVHGRRIYELFFSPQLMDYDDRDLTRFNLDIGAPGFVDIAKAVQPDTQVFMPRGDGQAVGLLYDPNDEVEALWRIQTLGVIENVRVLPAPDDTSDDLVYFVVRRVIASVTRRFIEKLADRADCVGGVQNLQLDCHYAYSGAPVSTVQVPWLPSTTVAVWADAAYLGTAATDGSGNCAMPDGHAHSNIVVGLAGAQVNYNGAATNTLTGLSAYEGLTAEVFADQVPRSRLVRAGTFTVSGGQITLPPLWMATHIVAFVGFMAPFMSAKLEYGAQRGSALTQTKKLDAIGLVLRDAYSVHSLLSGQRFDRLDPMPLIEGGTDVPSMTWGEYDAPMQMLPGEWDTDARLCLLAQAPYPVKVSGVVIGEKTNG